MGKSARNQAAFLEAYAGHDLTGDEQTLLAAYVADKAVYECVYEARNRPTLAGHPDGRAESVPDPTPGRSRDEAGIPISEIDQLTRGEHGQPHAVLGPHPTATTSRSGSTSRWRAPSPW